LVCDCKICKILSNTKSRQLSKAGIFVPWIFISKKFNKKPSLHYLQDWFLLVDYFFQKI